MPGKVAKIGTFSDWVGLFDEWRKEIGVNRDEIAGFKFDTLYGAIETEEIQFGAYKGRRKWENLRQVPTQQMRDALHQPDRLPGRHRVRQRRAAAHLFQTAPTDWDRKALTRVMIEEMRHGWQMCALLVEHFGYSGKVEAQKMLERRAFENKRLLGAFNVDVDNWMDFFTYTDFVDRDGKFQLQMLKYSAFAPLGRSMSYMLREEAFHMGTGNDGLRRIVEAASFRLADPEISQQVDFVLLRLCLAPIIRLGALGLRVGHQRVATTSPRTKHAAKLDELNDYNRHLYRDEVAGLIERFNSFRKPGEPELYAPNIKIQSQHRPIRRAEVPCARPVHALGDKEYDEHFAEAMPTTEDKKLLLEIIANEKKWIARKRVHAILSNDRRARKSAINL